jgi:hypothetical protein
MSECLISSAQEQLYLTFYLGVLFDIDDEFNTFFRNVGKFLRGRTASQPLYPQISHLF